MSTIHTHRVKGQLGGVGRRSGAASEFGRHDLVLRVVGRMQEYDLDKGSEYMRQCVGESRQCKAEDAMQTRKNHSSNQNLS